MPVQEIKIYYGSETGNAESIALEINKTATEKGLTSAVYEFDDFLKEELKEITYAVFVVSTTGDGDPPEIAEACFRNIQRLIRALENKKNEAQNSENSVPTATTDDKSEKYKNLRYAILGLGDTNYTNFNNASRKFERFMKYLHAVPFYRSGFADDAVGLDEVVEPWMAGLWPALEKCNLSTVSNKSAAVDSSSTTKPAGTQTSTSDAPEPELNKKLGNLKLNGFEQPKQNGVYYKSKRATTQASGVKLVIDFSELSKVKKLTGLPKAVESVLKIEYKDGDETNGNSSSKIVSNDFTLGKYPEWLVCGKESEGVTVENVNSNVFLARLVGSTCITSSDAIKRTLLLELDVSEAPTSTATVGSQGAEENSHKIGSKNASESWRAGDTFGIVAPNDPTLVRRLLELLRVDEKVWHTPLKITGPESGLPSHLKAFSTSDPVNLCLFDLFTWKTDLTSVPKRQLLRVFSDYCTDKLEKLKLQFLSSKNGLTLYNHLRSNEPNFNVINVLATFPSIQIEPALLVELLPPLVSRPYSISSSNLENNGIWKFAFNVVEYAVGSGAEKSQKLGVCTPWLDLLCDYPPASLSMGDTVGAASMTAVHQANGDNATVAPLIPVYLRPNISGFRLPALEEDQRPIIMIAAGTGIAPFIGFMDQRLEELKRLGTATSIPEMHLYFGCRNRNNDFLFQSKLGEHVSSGVLSNLRTCFSREATTALSGDMAAEDKLNVENGVSGVTASKYVQDLLRADSDSLLDLILLKDAVIYVCGDANGMGKDVNTTLANLLVQKAGACAVSNQSLQKILSSTDATIHAVDSQVNAAKSQNDSSAGVEESVLTLPQALQILNIWSSTRKYNRDLWS